MYVQLILSAEAIDGHVQSDRLIQDVQVSDAVDQITGAGRVEIAVQRDIARRTAAEIQRDGNRQSRQMIQLRHRAIQVQPPTEINAEIAIGHNRAGRTAGVDCVLSANQCVVKDKLRDSRRRLLDIILIACAGPDRERAV